MRKIIFNKKFLAIVGICLSVAGGFAIKQKITTKASDHSFEVNGMNVSIQQCEGKSEEIMEEDLDETISNEVMALEEKGHNYEIGDTIETEEVALMTCSMPETSFTLPICLIFFPSNKISVT